MGAGWEESWKGTGGRWVALRDSTCAFTLVCLLVSELKVFIRLLWDLQILGFAEAGRCLSDTIDVLGFWNFCLAGVWPIKKAFDFFCYHLSVLMSGFQIKTL